MVSTGFIEDLQVHTVGKLFTDELERIKSSVTLFKAAYAEDNPYGIQDLYIHMVNLHPDGNQDFQDIRITSKGFTGRPLSSFIRNAQLS